MYFYAQLSFVAICKSKIVGQLFVLIGVVLVFILVRQLFVLIGVVLVFILVLVCPVLVNITADL